MPKQTPFHDAEIAVQQRLGVRDQVAQYGDGFIRDAMPQQHRDFFNELPMLLVGITDDQGHPWSLPLFGEPGFIQASNGKTLSIRTLPELSDTLGLSFHARQKIGVLGIQLDTRRRNRMNGVIKSISSEGFSLAVEQSFGNCPQYIQTRELQWRPNPTKPTNGPRPTWLNKIDQQAKDFIEQTDTFFIASRTAHFTADPRTGIDTSHRGGKPGFIKVEGQRLYFPDFSGNRFFNTIGNIESDGRVGLCFPDFSNGDLLLLTGRAEVLWDLDAAAELAGAERIIAVQVEKLLRINRFMPLLGDMIEQSPSLDHTGTWHKAHNSSPQPFKIIDKQTESDSVTSFYLAPVNSKQIPAYTPGQYLPIQIDRKAAAKPVSRSYTLSRAPDPQAYRISVKREPHGLTSRFLHDQLEVGDTLLAGRPQGDFVLQNNDHAVVMLSGGIGITPMIAMLEGLIDAVAQGAQARPVWFIHGTQNSRTHAFSKQLQAWSQQHQWLQVYTIYSQPLASDHLGDHHQFQGHISIKLLKQILPFDHFDFYLCGSAPFMRSIYNGLLATGVSSQHIYHEFFGPGSLADTPDTAAEAVAKTAQVRFTQSQISSTWTPAAGSLLELAEQQGLQPAYSCRSGNCGVCACRLKSGAVTYPKSTGFQPNAGEVLICSAQPAKGTAEVVLDL